MPLKPFFMGPRIILMYFMFLFRSLFLYKRKRTSPLEYIQAHLHIGKSVHQRSGRSGFNFRSSHTKDSKMVLDTSLLNTQYYMIRFKGKWSNPKKGVAPSLTPRSSYCWAFRLLSSTVTYLFNYVIILGAGYSHGDPSSNPG